MEDAKVVTASTLPDDTIDFRLAHPEAELPRGGYITGLSAIAYLASGSEWFGAAAGAHEDSDLAIQDAAYAACVWLAVQENLLHYFPQTAGILAGEMALKALLESGEVDGIARRIGSRTSEQLPPYAYADWSRSFQTHSGLVLIPGYWGLRVNVAKLRAAAPPVAEPAKPGKGTSGQDRYRLYEPVFKKLFAMGGFDSWANLGQQKRWEKVQKAWPIVLEKKWTAESCPHKGGVNNNWERFLRERAEA